MQSAICATPNLEVIEAEVDDLKLTNGQVHGVKLADGRDISVGAVVLTTGTFLRGLIYIGEKQIPAGRVDEARPWAFPEHLRISDFRWGV